MYSLLAFEPFKNSLEGVTNGFNRKMANNIKDEGKWNCDEACAQFQKCSQIVVYGQEPNEGWRCNVCINIKHATFLLNFFFPSKVKPVPYKHWSHI